MLRRLAQVSVGLAGLLLVTSAVFAQSAGDSSGAMPDSSATLRAKAAAAKPFASFTGIISGTFDLATGACPGVGCSTGDICECLSMTSISLKATGLGTSKFTANINLDTTTKTPNGAGSGFCELASGPATITSGADAVSLDLTTEFCQGFAGMKFDADGGWTVVGGMGKLSSAAGTGVITLTGAVGAPPQTTVPVAGSMNGIFHK